MNPHFGVHILCVPFCHLLPWFRLWDSSHHFFVVFCLVCLYDDISLPALFFRVQEPLVCFDFCHLKLKVSNCSILSPFVLGLCVFVRISSPELLEECMRCLVQGLYTILCIELSKMCRVSCQKRPCTKFGTGNNKPFFRRVRKIAQSHC